MNHSRDFAGGIKHLPALINTKVQNMSKLIFAFQKSYWFFISTQTNLEKFYMIVGILSLVDFYIN